MDSQRKRGDINHLSIHQWLRSATCDSQQPTFSIGFLFLKLPPPPCAVLLVISNNDPKFCCISENGFTRTNQYFLKAIVPALDPPLLQRNPLLGSQRAVQWRVDRGTYARGKCLGVPIPVAAGRDEPKFNGSAIVRVTWGLV